MISFRFLVASAEILKAARHTPTRPCAVGRSVARRLVALPTRCSYRVIIYIAEARPSCDCYRRGGTARTNLAVAAVFRGPGHARVHLAGCSGRQVY